MKTVVRVLRTLRGAFLPALLLLGFVTLAEAASTHTPPPAGVAPVGPPPGGLAIDGDLFANTPQADVGDWMLQPNAPPPGTGGVVLDATGAPLNPTTTFHVRDGYNNLGNDSVFVGGLKWFDNPNSWEWTAGKSSTKTDIHNVLLHIATDANSHVWAVISADRASTSGDSYIDFEFLQNPLVRSNTGAFLSAGPHGGRTTNDLLLSLAFTGGGKVADFFVWRWQALSGGGFGYVEVTASLPPGRVFAALNTRTIAVPYGAFGQTTYEPNAFAEGALDLTALVSSFDPCLSIGVKTIMVKTKASQSNTATIEDFIDPIQYTLTIGPSADAGPDQIRCDEGGSTAFALHGQVTAGIRPITSTQWSVVAGTATIEAPQSLTTTARLTTGSATLRLTVHQEDGCTETDDLVLTVAPLPACAIDGPATVCPGSAVSFRAPAGMTYAWSIRGNGAISGPTNAPTVTVTAGSVCGEGFVLTLRASGGLCSSTCDLQVMVEDNTPPSLVCPEPITVGCAAEVPAPNPALVGRRDNCDPSGAQVTVTHVSDVISARTCPNRYVITRTYRGLDPCGNAATCAQLITVDDQTAPVLTAPAPVTVSCASEVPAPNPALVGRRDNCDPAGANITVTHVSDVLSGQTCPNRYTITRTYRGVDACGNASTCTQLIAIDDQTAPVLTAPAPVTVTCAGDVPAPNPALVGRRDNCDPAGAHVTVTHAGDVISGQTCPNRYTITRSYRGVDACGNASTCTQLITVDDRTAPVLTAPAPVTVSCAGDVPAPNPALVGRSDNCDPTGASVTVTHASDVISAQTCPNRYTITRTYQGIDQCGNRATCEQTIRVDDRMAPSLNWPALTTVSCARDIPAPDPRVVTATDGCGGAVTVVHVRDVISNSNCLNQFTLTRTYRATDACGNSAVCDQIFRVEDRGLPSVSGPAPVTVNCAGDIPAPDPSLVTATDTCGGPVTVVHVGDTLSMSNCLNQFTLRRTYRAIDACGNAASCIQTITVRDTTAPTLRVPADVVVECPADTRPSATGLATAEDGCGPATVRYSDSERKLCGGSKEITRTWTASDACGNSTSGTQTIRVEDRRPPEISCELVCTYSQGGYGGWSGTPTDILVAHYVRAFPQGLEVGLFDTAGGNAPPNGLRWERTSAGLAALQQYLKQGGGTSEPLGRDVLNPTDSSLGGELAHQAVTLTLNIRFNTLGIIGVGPNNFGALIYTQPGDSLSHSTVSEILAAANRALAGLELPRGHTYSSLNNLLDKLNMSFHECTRSTWSREHLDTPRVIVQCLAEVPPPNPARIRASDACGGPVTVLNLPDEIRDQTCLNRFLIARTWLAWDACGNTNSCVQLIEVNDTTPPTLNCPADQTVALEDVWTFGEPSATDNCGPVHLQIVSTETNEPAPHRRVATRTWEAVDACGNSQICHQTITVLTDRLVQSTFDFNDEGWRQIGGGTVRLAAHLDGDGSAGGYVSGTDGLLGNGWFWVAPSKFYGDRLAAYDGLLEFALRQDSATAPDLPNDVILAGGGITLVYNLPAPSDTDWHTYSIRLNEQAGWYNWDARRPATQAEIMIVLAALDTLMIRGDYSLGTTPGSLDSVALLLPAQTPSGPWKLEIFRVGEDQVMLRWPILAVGWELETTASFTLPVWVAIPETPVVVQGMNTVTFTATGDQAFFRLHKVAP